MKKIIPIFVITIFLFGLAVADDVPRGKPFEAIWSAINDLIQMVDNLAGRINALEDVNYEFDCVTITNLGRTAYCPEDYIVTTCYGGNHHSSHNYYNDHCEDQSSNDWTGARCCRVKKVW